MPRGQFTDPAVKLRAVAELAAGVDLQEIADRLGLNPKTIQTWKKTFDEGGLLDGAQDAADEAPPPAPAPASPPAHAPTLVTGAMKLSDGSELPAISPQRDGATRRIFDDDFKYLVGRALLARRTKIMQVAEHYDISRGLLRDWSEAVQTKKLKPSAELRARERAGATNGAATSNGHAAPAARAAAASQLTIEGISMPPTTIVPYQPHHVAPPMPQELADLLLRVDRSEAEAARLRRENEVLRVQLRQAFDMVLAGAAAPSL